MTDKPLFGWLQSLYPLWKALDEESIYLSAWIGLGELALSGAPPQPIISTCILLGQAICLLQKFPPLPTLEFVHPTRGSISLSEKDGGLPPDDVVEDDDDILAAAKKQ